MSVTTADHNLVNNVLQPLTNGDDIVDVDVRHELGDASTLSKENSEVKVVLSTTKEIPADDIVAKATDAAAEALLLHLETNGDLATIPTTEASKESHEEAQLVSTVDGASNEHSILPAVEVKVESTQDALTEPSVDTVPVGDEESLDYPSVTNVGASIESEAAANSSLNDGSLDLTESDELEHAVTLVPSLEDAADASDNAGNTPPVSSNINVADTHSEQTETTMKLEDSVEVSASASFSEDAPTAEIPTITPEAAVAHSSSELEEKANTPDPELVEPTSHGDATSSLNALPTSVLESHNVPSQVAAERECLAEEIGTSKPTQVEASTPITSDVSLSQPTTITQVFAMPTEDTSILDGQEPMTVPSGGEDEVARQKIVQMHNEMGGVGNAPSLDIEEPAATSTAASTEEAPIMDPDALAQVDTRIVEDEDKKVSKGKTVVAGVTVVEESATAHERSSDVNDIPVADEVLNVEGTPPIAEKVVVEAVPVTAVEPVVEETESMEVETPATNVDVTIVEDVMQVVEEVSAKTDEAPTTEDVPAMNVEASTVEQTVIVEPEPSPTNTEALILNPVPVIEEKVLATDLAVVEVAAIEEDPLVTNTEIPAIETETQATSAEISIVENALVEEVSTVAQPSTSEVKTPATEADVADVNAVVSTTESGQAVFEITSPPLAQEDETEAASPSPAQSETIIGEKPIETSLQNVEEDMVKGDPLIKAEVEDVPSQIGEAVVVEHNEEAAAEETRDAVTTVFVDGPSASKEHVTLEEFTNEEVTAATEEQPEAVIVNADAAEGGKDNTEKDAIPVTHSELELTIDNNLQSLASEPVGVPVVDHKEILHERSNVSDQEPPVDTDELEPSSALPTPVDESVATFHAQSTEDHKPVVAEALPDVQMTMEELPPAVPGNTIELPEEGQSAIPFDTESNVGQQVPPVKDTSPTASTESIEAPNSVTSGATSTDLPSVEEKPDFEEAVIEAHLPITDAPTEDRPGQLEDSLTKSEQEPQVEIETVHVQVEVEPQEVNPTVDELPTMVTQPNMILVHEEALTAETAIEEAKTTELTPEINYNPTIPLPIDEVSEEVPEVAQQETGEALLEVRVGAEPPASAHIEGVIVLEKELTQEALDEKVEIRSDDEAPAPDTLEDGLGANLSSETSPAPPGEIATVIKSDDLTEASLPVLSKNEQHIVDEATLFPSRMTVVQESIDVITPATAPEEALVVDETSASEEIVDKPGQEPSADVVELNVDEHNIAPHAEDITDTVIPTPQEEDHSLTAEHAPPQEIEHIENGTEAGQVETVQEVNFGEAPATEENASTPEQPSTHVTNDQVYSSHVELATASSTTEEAENTEEIAPATSASAVGDGPATNDIFEPPTTKDLELEFDGAEDEGQPHTGGTKPTEQLTTLNDELLSPASGTEIERPKSPWTPSFQVTTVGRGVSSSDEDEEAPTPETKLFEDAPILEAPVHEGAVVEAILEVPQVVTPVEENGDVVEDSALSSGVAQSDADNTTLDTPPAEIARPWTPSYSVHSQGSPLHGATELEQDVPINTSIDSHEQTEDGPELPDMEFAANEEASKGTILVASAEKSEEVVKVLQQCDPAVTEAPGEKSALPSPPPPIDEDAPVDQAATTPVVIPTVIKDMDIQARNLEVDVEVSHAEEDTRGLGSVLDAAEKDIATQMGEVSIEESSPVEEVVQVPQLVLHTGDDVTELHNPPDKESSVLHLTPQQLEQTQERPASPSWVASYSVSTQGSPLQEHAPLVEELASTIEVTPEDSPSPTSALAETHSEVTVQHNVSQESTEGMTADETQVKDLENETYAEAAHVKASGFMVLVSDAEANAQEDTPPTTSLTLVDNLPDHPKSPWTPSYSVTMQGPDTPGDEELDNIEPLPQRALDINTTKNVDDVELKNEAIAPEPERVSSANSPLTTTAESKLPPAMALERELQELQATIHSDRDATSVANVAIVDAAAQEYFPSVETTEQKSKLSKLSVSRLAPVDEVEGTDAGPITSETVSSPSSRSRLESTTSSRFFPGGWFSTASKVADEGRTSLEIAQGEFTPSKIISPVPLAGDVSDTPDDASATSVATGHATDSDDDDDEPEPKRRWCVVM